MSWSPRRVYRCSGGRAATGADIDVSEEIATLGLAVECYPGWPDEDFPIRLIIFGGDGEKFVELKFTPDTAEDSGPSVVSLVSYFVFPADVETLAEKLKVAATKVRANRN